jgi:LmbE family N-acetylglucosaminyl deacetylase
VLALLCAALLFPPAEAQVRPIYDLGAAGLLQTLQRLTTTASALHTGAHPDDEDSAFMARTARGDHARVAYLSLTRGEGGQNIIGPELFEALGIIRSEELLQARRLDGGTQFFTRAFDFGFSKTRAETAARWNERDVLADVVRVIRAFRPLVVYSRFSGTPADGHGHHQMAGHLTRLAFEAAGDPAAFPELAAEGLRPWAPRKLYLNAGRGAGPGGPALELATGAVDPAIGRSYAAIAAEGRSQHKSQQMGSIEPLGPAVTTLRLTQSRVPAEQPERSIFDGIDVSLRGLGTLAGLPPGALAPELSAIDAAVADALRRYQPLDPAGIAPILADGLRATRRAREALATMNAAPDARADADTLLAHKEVEFSDALVRAAGVIVDPLADDETIAQGSGTVVAVRTFAASPSLVRITDAGLAAPEGWLVAAADDDRRGTAPFRRESPIHSARFRVTVPRDAALSEPFFVGARSSGADMYASARGGRPFDPPLLTGRVTLEIAGVALTVTEPVVHRAADPIRGELRRDVHVVPPVAIRLDTSLLIVPAGGARVERRIVAQVTSLSSDRLAGVMRLQLPAGWTSSPAEVPFTLERRGEPFAAPFVVVSPGRLTAGTLRLSAEARVDGRAFTRDAVEIAYPHIQTHRMFPEAAVAARVIDVAVAQVRVGYIMGSGDQVPDALRRLGLDVTLLDDEMLAFGDLSMFDTIVVGIRAAEARPAFVRHHGRLREFMERGGTLIVQYQQQEYVAAGLAPYPVQMNGNARITDETASVAVLAPAHPAFTFPNRISPADFDGWIQERNLYALTGFDDRYTPLLESADPGEPPQRGGQVYADVGRGRYVYTSYSWFRQLPAGVPGAYRLFANLVSLPRAPRADSPAPGSVPRTGGAEPPAADRTRPSR